MKMCAQLFLLLLLCISFTFFLVFMRIFHFWKKKQEEKSINTNIFHGFDQTRTCFQTLFRSPEVLFLFGLLCEKRL